MATVTIGPITGGSTPSYAANNGRVVAGAGELWSTLLAGAGTYGSPSFSGMCGIYNTAAYSSYGYWNSVSSLEVVIDYRDYIHLNVTAAYFQVNCYKSLATPLVQPWSLDSLNGVSFTLQDETTRGTNWQFATTWPEVMDGAVGGTQITTSVPWSSLPTTASNQQWHFNSAGLSYLNSIKSKANHPGYLFAAANWVGVILDLEPIFPYPPSKLATSQFLNPGSGTGELYLVLTYDSANPTVGIPVGSTQKAVGGAKINISNTWKTISEMKVQVGGAWKDVS